MLHNTAGWSGQPFLIPNLRCGDVGQALEGKQPYPHPCKVPRWRTDSEHLTHKAITLLNLDLSLEKAWEPLILYLWKLINTWEIPDHCDVTIFLFWPHRKAHMEDTPSVANSPRWVLSLSKIIWDLCHLLIPHLMPGNVKELTMTLLCPVLMLNLTPLSAS